MDYERSSELGQFYMCCESEEETGGLDFNSLESAGSLKSDLWNDLKIYNRNCGRLYE